MTLTLKGVDYPLRFSVNALCCLEEKTGKSLAQLQTAQLSCLRGLVWCGLMEAHPDLTIEKAGEMIDAHLAAGGSLAKVSEQVAAALEDACFFPHPPANAPAPPEAPSVGSTVN